MEASRRRSAFHTFLRRPLKGRDLSCWRLFHLLRSLPSWGTNTRVYEAKYTIHQIQNTTRFPVHPQPPESTFWQQNVCTQPMTPASPLVQAGSAVFRNMTSIRRAPTSFTLFPRLPAELRLMIWNEALPGARTFEITEDLMYIDVYPYPHCDEDERLFWFFTEIRDLKRSGQFQNSLLQLARIGFLSASHEARRIGLKHYKLRRITPSGGLMYVDPDRDVFSLSLGDTRVNLSHSITGLFVQVELLACAFPSSHILRVTLEECRKRQHQEFVLRTRFAHQNQGHFHDRSMTPIDGVWKSL